MNIYLIQMTAGQSDNNSHKSEHETATTLPEWQPTEPDRDDRGQRTRIIEYNTAVQNNIVDWPEAAQKYRSYKEKVG